jgi:hypothetical protein
MSDSYNSALELNDSPDNLPLIERPITRRALLATAGAALVGKVLFTAETSYELVPRLLGPDIASIPSDVPPQLEHLTIPQHNEHFTTPLATIASAFRNVQAKGITPFYTKPSYYLSTFEFIHDFAAEGAFTNGVHTWVTPYTKPYFNAIEFSRTVFFDTYDLYATDPGSTSKRVTTTLLAEAAAQPLQANGIPPVDSEAAKIAIGYGKEFIAMKRTIDARRGEEKVSTSVLLEEYLLQNQGDIVRSLWDTTLFLKLGARADIHKMLQPNLFKDTTTQVRLQARSGAELLSAMFYDDFSSKVPLDWLLTTIPPNDGMLNASSATAYQNYKDYMPVNRDGAWYHVYNIAAMTTFMDPLLVETFMANYYSDHSYAVQQGRIKTETDLIAVRQIRSMRKLFEQYK